MTSLTGRLTSGLGKAAGFTQIDWVRRQLIDMAGIDPYPGTVNLQLESAAARVSWQKWRDLPGQRMDPDAAAFCSAICYPARLDGRVPAAVIVPEVQGYPEDKVELVAALNVRTHLGLQQEDLVEVTRCSPIPGRAVLFDIDGTLVDSVGAYLEVARLAAAPHGLTVTEVQIRHSLATGGNFWNSVVPQAHPDRDRLMKTMSTRAMQAWPDVLREHGRVFPGLAQTLDVLAAMGMRLAIVSGARPEVLDLLREDDVLDRFESIVLGADVSRRKPDPEGILKGLKALNVEPGSAIYVGDTPVDITASRAAGTKVIGVLTGAGDSASLSSHGPDRLAPTHAKLPGMMEFE